MAQVKMLNSRGKKKEFSFLEMVPLEFPGIYDLLERFSQCTAHPWHRPSWFTCTLEGTSLYISSLHHGLTFHLVLISLVGGIMKVESLARVLLAWVSGVSLFQPSGLLLAVVTLMIKAQDEGGEGVSFLGKECSGQREQSVQEYKVETCFSYSRHIKEACVARIE